MRSFIESSVCWSVLIGNGKCENYNSQIHPGAPEFCDAFDNDCDGWPGDTEVDREQDGFMVCEGDCDDSDSNNWFSCATCTDADGDGYRVVYYFFVSGVKYWEP